MRSPQHHGIFYYNLQKTKSIAPPRISHIYHLHYSFKKWRYYIYFVILALVIIIYRKMKITFAFCKLHLVVLPLIQWLIFCVVLVLHVLTTVSWLVGIGTRWKNVPFQSPSIQIWTYMGVGSLWPHHIN